MYRAERIVLSKKVHREEWELAQRGSVLAKQLYNAALFRIRQAFTGWEKDVRTPNEKVVFEELDTLRQAYPDLKAGKVLSYTVLEKLMRVTRNTDFFSGLPMQTAQAVVREAAGDFRNWLAALRTYQKDPSRFRGRPGMPRYSRGERKTFTISNQDAVLYPVYEETADGKRHTGMELKLPGIKRRLFLPHLPEDARLKEVKVRPYYGTYILILVLERKDILTGEENDSPLEKDRPNMAGIDLGVDNIAAIVTTDHASRVYKGGAVLAWNRLYHKEKARAAGILMKGTGDRHARSRRLERLSRKHDACVRDIMHKISADIIRFCDEHRVGVIVIGYDPLWKQGVKMGAKQDQNFVSVPHAMLRWMITYKAEAVGIRVVLREESYTSQADVTSGDLIPVYGQVGVSIPVFSGRRVCRGLYRCGNGLMVNADCSGAANILRKEYPEAWSETADFVFLAHPEPVTFRKLNRRRAV